MTTVERASDDEWGRVIELGARLHLRGFTNGRALGSTAHEVRALDGMRIDDSRFVAISGDKSGQLYSGVFDLRSGEPHVPWSAIPADPRRSRRVVDALRIIPHPAGLMIVIATRGNGVWLMPLSPDGQACPNNAVQLPGSEGMAVRHILFDPHSSSLLCAAEISLHGWSLEVHPPSPTGHWALPALVTAMALCIAPADDPRSDTLWLATNDCALYRVPRAPDGQFHPEPVLEAEPRWQGEQDVVQTLLPLSDLGPQWPMGVVAGTLRHLVVLWNDQETVRLVVSDTEILHLAPLRSAQLHGLLVFTLDATALLFRRCDHHGPIPVGTQNPGEALLSDAEPIECFADRVYASCSLYDSAADDHEDLPLVVGLGNHQVSLHHVTDRGRLEQELHESVARLVKRHGITALLGQLERWALSSAREHRELKRTYLALLPELGEHCERDEDWERIPLLVWDLLARSEDMPDIPVMAVQSLRRLQSLRRKRIQRDRTLEDLIADIRKFVLDRKSFSGKHARFLELVGTPDPALADDRIVYRSILISRRQDPIFHRSFESDGQFGEIRAFAPMTGPNTEGGNSNEWDRVLPKDLRLLAATFRGALWMLDGTGEARLLHRETVGRYVRNFYFRRDDVIFALTDGTLQAIDRSALMRAWDEHPAPPLHMRSLRPPDTSNPHIYSFCGIPGSDRWQERRFLSGDMAGRISLELDGTRQVLVDLSRYESPNTQGRRQVYDMRAAELRFGERTHRIVVACTTTGYVHLLRWKDGPSPELEPEGLPIRLDRPCVCLLYPDPLVHQAVVGSRDGNVTAYQIVERGDGRALVLLPLWAYQTAEEVRALHMYQPRPRANDPGEHRGPLVLIASHDRHIHALDLQGRQLEVYLFEGMKVDRFVVGQPADDDDHDYVDARIYACAFENQVRGVRLISRRRLLHDFDHGVDSPGQIPEHTLARWRAYAIREGHLRHRFILQSRRYPGEGAKACIAEIHALLAGEDSSERRTGELAALLRRLFRGSTGPGHGSGLAEILADPQLYITSIELLKDLANRWSSPGSAENRKVQLHWIRSFLHRIHDRATLTRWAEVAGEVDSIESVLDYRPGPLLLHFLQHPNELIQFKTLEYLERMLFGWPGVKEPGLLLRPEGIRGQDLEWIVDTLLARLRFDRRPLNSGAPPAVILSVTRILTLLMMHGFRDPMYLAYQLRTPEVDAGIYPVLAHQAEATRSLAACSPDSIPSLDETNRQRCDERLDRAAAVMQRMHRLNHALSSRHHHAEGHTRVVVALRGVLRLCTEHPADGPDRVEVEELRHYFELLLPVLRVNGLEALRKLDPASLRAAYGPRLFPSAEALAHLEPVLDAATSYGIRKWRDWDEGMKSLRFIDMELWRYAWKRAQQVLRQVPTDGFQDLLQCLDDRWMAVLDEEQDRQLLQDMTGLVEGFLLSNPPHEIPADRETAVRILDEESDLVRQAFSSYVTRLALFARPTEALFFYLDPGANLVRGRILLPSKDKPIRHLVRFESEPPLPSWVDPKWRDPDHVATLEKNATKSWLDASKPELEWEVNGLSYGDEDDVSRFRAFYVLGWRKDDRKARKNHTRFTDHRLAWDFLLDAIDLRQSSIIHRVEVGRFYTLLAHNLGTPLYHIKSDLQILIDGFFENDKKKRQDKYLDLLRAARHMDGQFDSILSLSGRRIRLETQDVFVAQVVYDVVRTVRKSDARAKGTNIVYPRPPESPGHFDVLNTDEERLFDIVLSLVTNAVKYGPRGSVVEVVVQCSDRGTDVQVIDQGPGVDVVDRPFIFDPFYRGRAAIKSGETGVGLGLYTARRFSELLGGRVNVSNNDGAGATFSLFIPRSAGE